MNGDEESLEKELKTEICFLVGECLYGRVDKKQSRSYIDEAELAQKLLCEQNKKYKGSCLFDLYENLKKEGF